MISLIVKLLNFCAATLHYSFSIASLVGQVIVTFVLGFINTITNILKAIYLFFEILYEDNLFILTDDLPNFANSTVSLCYEQWKRLENFVGSICNDIIQSIFNTSSAAAWFLHAVFTVLFEVIILLKNTIIFAGKTSWFILTFIPVQLPLLISNLYNFVKELFVQLGNNLGILMAKGVDFLNDVPLESCIGILVGVVIIRVSIEFRDVIQYQMTELYWICVRKALYLYHMMYNYIMDSEARTIRRLANGDDVGIIHEDVLEEEDPAETAEALCVVCQERQKCILILPCRHVCLCRDCCIRLYNYQRTCPICRTFIYHSVTIYL